MSRICAVRTDKFFYPEAETLFRPSVCYPEYLFKDNISKEDNHVYDMVRQGFIMQQLDKDNIGSESWNPLGDIVKKGDRVLIKPNMVLHKNLNGMGEWCLYTHPSVVAAIVDYVLIALNGTGSIIIGDAPVQECEFDKLLENSGYRMLLDFYISKGADISIIDFRNVKTYEENGIHYSQQVSDAENGVVVQLGEDSLFAGMSGERLDNLRITNYDPRIMKQHHNTDVHEYKIAKELLLADVIINVPKPKSHRKAGLTAALKNMVGINANKEYLPHHTLGSPSEGGDAYSSKNSSLSLANYYLDKKNISNSEGNIAQAKHFAELSQSEYLKGCSESNERFWEGSWYGNDTIWRTVADLNRIVMYADKNGVMTDKIQRKMYIIADMIVSGEKEGPLLPSPKKSGVLVFGEDPLCFDKAVASIMGFDCEKIPQLCRKELYTGKYGLASSSVDIISNCKEWNERSIEEICKSYSLNFVPSSGWVDILGDPEMEALAGKLQKCRNIVIFGAGIRGLYVAGFLKKNNIPIKCFCDNDKSKQNRSIIAGTVCVKPEDIGSECTVLISSNPKYNSEITAQLKTLGITEYYFCN